MDNETKTPLSKHEQNAVNTAAFLTFGIILVNSLYNVLFNNTKIPHVGSGWITGGFALMAAAVGITAAYIVLFVKRLVRIKQYKSRYIAILVLMLIMAVCEVWIGADYTADLFGGAHEVVTSEFDVAPLRSKGDKTTAMYFEDGEDEVRVKIPNETAAEFINIPLISDDYSEAISENGHGIHTESVYIRYYPRSKVLKEIRKA